MTVNELAETLSIEFPGCPLATLRDMIRWAERELCTEGNIWISRGEPVVVAANTSNAEIEPPSGGEALRIFGLLQDGRRLKPGVDYRQIGVSAVEFRRTASANLVYGELVCRPAPGSDMPEELITRWSEALLDGARYRIFMLPQAWKDPQQADFYRRRFLDAQAYGRDLACSDYQAGSVRMRTRPFA